MFETNFIAYILISICIVIGTFNYFSRQKKTSLWAKKLAKLDLTKDADVDEGIKQMSTIDYPFEIFLALNFAFYRTFCSPSISNVYVKTGTIYETTEKRVNDTDLLMHTWMEHGLDSEVGTASYKQLNKIHDLHSTRTRNVDFIFVLCCLTVDAIQFCNHYGSRPILDKERQVIWEFYRRVGKRMELKDIPVTLQDCINFVDVYTEDNRQARVSEDGKVLTEAITKLVCQWYSPLPDKVCRMAVSVILFQMSETFHRKLGLTKPSAIERSIINTVLLIRKAALQILPPRTKPYRLSDTLLQQDYGCPMSKSVLSKVGPIDMLAKF